MLVSDSTTIGVEDGVDVGVTGVGVEVGEARTGWGVPTGLADDEEAGVEENATNPPPAVRV